MDGAPNGATMMMMMTRIPLRGNNKVFICFIYSSFIEEN